MPQFSYDRQTAFAGKIDRPFEVREIESRVNRIQVQISTITLAGFDAGTYTIRLRQPSTGRQYDFSAVSAGVSTAAILASLQAAINAEPDFANLFTDSVSDPDLVLTFMHPGDAWEVSFPSNPNGNMSAALTQESGADPIPFGIGVVSSDLDFCAPPTNASTDANFLGISVRNAAGAVIDFDNEAHYLGGDAVSILTKGYVWVEVEDAVTFGANVFVRKNATGTEQAGAFRSDADGGDAIQLTGAKFKSSTSGAGLALIKIDR